MDPIVFDGIKFVLNASIGAGAAWWRSRGLTKKVHVLEDQNQQQQLNVDNMQTSMITYQAQLIRYQEDLIEARAEIDELRGRLHVFELKSSEDENLKRALRERVAELEALCIRQQVEIIRNQEQMTTLRKQLGLPTDRISDLEVEAMESDTD